VKRKREFLACKGLQADLQRKHPQHHVSLSHAHGWGIFALALKPLGMDAENQHEHISEAMLQLIVANAEEASWARPDGTFCAARALDLWLLKEALFKATASLTATFDPAKCIVYAGNRWLIAAKIVTRRGLRIAVLSRPTRIAIEIAWQTKLTQDSGTFVHRVLD